MSGIDYKKLKYGLDYENYFSQKDIEYYFDVITKYNKYKYDKYLITSESFKISENDLLSNESIFKQWYNDQYKSFLPPSSDV
ncbi:hypothetical protein [Mycoplasma leonicaptivi]|uniref:hypothetical protein n=1 Tax=Mycoplasma leonicaptivi TaxID=36742 RepID=UPI0004856F3C|nr:hypothetical protein [Mycoplasma leonicaptivi]